MSTAKGIQRRKDKRLANQVKKANTPKKQKKVYATASDRPDLPQGEGSKRI